MQKLKINKNFVPAKTNAGDELFPNGIFLFNINRMLEFIELNKNDIVIENIDAEEYHFTFSIINEDHIDSVDITKPVILIEINPGIYNLIDGHHRVEKAFRNGIGTIRAYKLTVNQHINFLTEMKSYFAFIDYWNGKVKDINRLKKVTI